MDLVVLWRLFGYWSWEGLCLDGLGLVQQLVHYGEHGRPYQGWWGRAYERNNSFVKRTKCSGEGVGMSMQGERAAYGWGRKGL